MHKVKVISRSKLIYRMVTHQGTIEINGKEIEYRYSEDDNGATLYTYESHGGWTEYDPSIPEHEILSMMISEWGVDLGPSGDAFEYNPEEEFNI